MKNTFLLLAAITLSFSLPAQTDSTTPKSSQKTSIERIDAEMSATKKSASDSEGIQWINAKQLNVEGIGWNKNIEDYTRIPNHFKNTVTNNVWNLSRHSAGVAVQFTVSGTSFIEAKWKLIENRFMAHMTPVGINGVDLYVKLNNKWQWAGIGKPDKDGLNQQAVIRKGFLPEKTYECLLYLPLYTAVSEVEIGFSPQAEVKSEENTKKPLVFYGTSILHGCSASRAGMSFSSMLGRYFDQPVVNLGFSGNGLMEDYFANILGEIDAAVYVIDCLPNMSRFSENEIYERSVTLVKELRKIRPDVPIVLVEDRSYTHPNLTEQEILNPRRIALKSAYKTLKKEIKKLYYVEGDILIGSDNEATVDGSHPSDLGMYRYFQALKPTVSKALKRSGM